MTEEKYERPHIDYLSLDLPSHHITLGQVRKLYPDDELMPLAGVARRLDEMYSIEQDIVLLGYAATLGKEELRKASRDLYEGITWDDEEGEEGKAQEVKALKDYYIEYGVADGQETAGQLVRRLEEMGAQLARQRGVGPRG
jgi:hypothetical protein